MDEILIEDKKYVSSKRAAKVTGYAKDYIGQLCREGRVPARFVGRNWYVLESAIQDHRFGSGDTEFEKTAVEPQKSDVLEQKPILPPTWEQPRYESSSGDELPSVSRLQVSEEPEEQVGEQGIVGDIPTNLQESWQAWFNNFDNKSPGLLAPTSEVGAPTESVGEEHKDEIVENPATEIEIEKDVEVPIHTVYQLPPEELLPKSAKFDDIENEEGEMALTVNSRPRFSSVAIRAVKLVGIFIAVIISVTAILGSGYFDKYIISVSPAAVFAGISIYEK
jgi:hypothetical protein